MDTQLTVTGGLDPLSLIARADLAESTKTKYTRVLAEYLNTGGALGDPQALGDFTARLSPSRRGHLKAAVGLWAGKMTILVKGQATPENVGAVQASIMRFEALQASITVQAPKGEKTHTWLSPAEVKGLYNAVGNSIVGDRDRAILGLLVAAGLRREEAVNLRFEDIKYQPVGDRMRAVLAVKGKGAKDRTVPISDTLARHLDKWGQHVGHAGLICRSIGRLREPGESLSAVGLFKLVQKYGAAIGKPEL